MNRDGRISLKIANKVNRFLPENSARFGKRVQDLGQDLFGCGQLASTEGPASLNSGLVPLVFAVGDREPVKRIDEDPPHGFGPLGRAIKIMVVLLRKVGGQFVPLLIGNGGRPL